MLLSLLLTVAGILLGALGSWFITHAYYKKSLRETKEDLRNLRENTERLLLKFNLDPQNISVGEILSLQAQMGKAFRRAQGVDNSGDPFWQHCPYCNSKKVLRRAYKKSDLKEGRANYEIIVRVVDGKHMAADIRFNQDTAYTCVCLNCQERRSFLKPSSLRDFPDSLFTKELAKDHPLVRLRSMNLKDLKPGEIISTRYQEEEG